MAIAAVTLAGCEMALDSSPSLPSDGNEGNPDFGQGPKRPIPIKPKKGTGSKIERPKLIDDLINRITSPGGVMEYEPYNIEKPR